MDAHTRNKSLIEPLRVAMYNFSEPRVRAALYAIISPNAKIYLGHPIGNMNGETLYDNAYADLFAAIPDLERRDTIVTAGQTDNGDNWVGCAGHYIGTFIAPWLDIPPTGQLVHMRFHEFFRFVNDEIVEIQGIWDIPEVMMQAGAWPMVPSLGREWSVPAPATLDGITDRPYDATKSATSRAVVIDMLNHMNRHPSQGGPEEMEMSRFWHPRMNWYGPAGIGTARGISGFRNWHQIPFLAAMPDRGQHEEGIDFHLFGDGDYVAVTGWPNMKQTLDHEGWLGLSPTGQVITLRSLDFWRIEDGLIRENWVLVDLLDVYAQLGIDVFARLREFNKARVTGQIKFPVGDA